MRVDSRNRTFDVPSWRQYAGSRTLPHVMWLNRLRRHGKATAQIKSARNHSLVDSLFINRQTRMATTRKQKPAQERTDTCKNCRHMHHERELTECRRYPPTPVYDGATGFIEHHYPTVEMTLYCGEFAAHLSS